MIKELTKIPKNWLTLEDCKELFNYFREDLEFSEPIPSFNTRYEGKLEGIISSVCQTFNGQYLNPTVLDASSAYFNQLVRSQAFRNGNKRIGVLFTHAFLINNGVDFTLTPEELFNFAVEISISGESGISFDKTKEKCKQVIANFTQPFQLT